MIGLFLISFFEKQMTKFDVRFLIMLLNIDSMPEIPDA